jgi:hypothetical protein
MKKNDGTKKAATTNQAPKGTVEYRTENGKRMAYTSLGNGNWQGNEVKKPKMYVVKSAPAFDSKKRKVSARKYQGLTKN